MSAKEEKFDDNFSMGGMTYGEVCGILKSRYEEIKKHPNDLNPGLDSSTYALEGVKLDMERRMSGKDDLFDPFDVHRRVEQADKAAKRKAT